nr:unnamed protein product [Callosobruchus analis]
MQQTVFQCVRRRRLRPGHVAVTVLGLTVGWREGGDTTNDTDSCDRNQHKRDRSELQCDGEGGTESRQEMPKNKYRKITHDDRSPRGSASVVSHRHSRADRSPREATSTGIDDDRSLRGSASNVTFSPRDRSPRGSTILEHRDDRSPRGSVLSLDFRDDLSTVLGHPGVSADNEVSENILEGILEEDILGTEDFAPNISEALAKDGPRL